MSRASALAVLIFARLDSRRLPGKTLLELNGRPILGRVIDRLRRTRLGGELIVATSDRPVDDPIAQFASSEGIAVFRGAAEDVAQRAYDCARSRSLSAFVRISADSPFIDPATVDMVAGRYAAGDVDLSTNVHPRSFPIGESAEAISTEALGLVLASSRDPADREHVTRYIYLHPDRFRIGNVSAAAGRYAGVSLSVDTAAEFAKASWIAGRLGDGLETASLDQLVELERDWHRQGQPGGIDEAKPN